MTNEHPDLLEKIASEMVKANGIKLPARLVRVHWKAGNDCDASVAGPQGDQGRR